MRKIVLYWFAVLAMNECGAVINRKRRESYRSAYTIGKSHFDIGNSFRSLRRDLMTHAFDEVITLPDYPSTNVKFYQISSNTIERPVQESQEIIPRQTGGPAIIPNYPPPATPVNAAASNVPGNGNAVFLGSGSIGVVNLGGGAYILGSGGLGYSETRRNPRPSIRVSTLPPIQAASNLLPAAVNSPEIPQKTAIFSYTYPTGQHLPVDQNGYEFLEPNRVGFGDPLPPKRLKITSSYAVPTVLKFEPQNVSPSPNQNIKYLAQKYPQILERVPQTFAMSETATQSELLNIN